jgi:hypothetical protein
MINEQLFKKNKNWLLLKNEKTCLLFHGKHDHEVWLQLLRFCDDELNYEAYHVEAQTSESQDLYNQSHKSLNPMFPIPLKF